MREIVRAPVAAYLDGLVQTATSTCCLGIGALIPIYDSRDCRWGLHVQKSRGMPCKAAGDSVCDNIN